MSEIAVIGGGAWGTGIAIVLGRKGTHRVRLWAHETDVCESIARHRVNEKFLPGRRIPDSVTAGNDLAVTLHGAQIVVSVMPSQHCRALFERMRPLLEPQDSDRQRHQGSGRGLPAAHDGGDCRSAQAGGRNHSSRWRTQRPFFRPGSRARRSHRHHHCLAASGTPAHGTAGIQRPEFSDLHQQRRDRRRTRRSA